MSSKSLFLKFSTVEMDQKENIQNEKVSGEAGGQAVKSPTAMMSSRKRRIEEEEKERKRPKMTPLEYEEKAAELHIKWVESTQRVIEISKSDLCGCSDKCYAKPIDELSGYCKQVREATDFLFDLAGKLERKAEDLRYEGYDN